MARSYRVAKYGGRTEAQKISAGRGGRGSLKIPAGTPRLRVDLNWEEAQEKTAHQARTRSLAAAGYDPKVLANMSPEATARLHAQMADDPLVAAKEEKAAALTQQEGLALAGLLKLYGEGRREFPQEDMEKPEEPDTANLPPSFWDSSNILEKEGDVDLNDAIGPPPESVSVGRTVAESEARGAYGDPQKDLKLESLVPTLGGDEAELARVQDDPASIFFEGEEDPTQPPLTRARELIGMFGELDPVNQERLFPEFLAAMTKFTEPLKEVDEWKKSWFAFETSDDGKTQWRITYNKEGTKELAKTKMPPNVEWKGVRIYKDGKPGYMHVNKNNPYEWHEDGKGNRIFMPLPKGAKFKANRVARKNNPKFTAWLMNHPTHNKLLPFGEGEKGYTVGFNDWLVGANIAKRNAAKEFSKTASGLEMLINLAIQNAGGVKEGANEFEQEEQRRKNLPGGLGE